MIVLKICLNAGHTINGKGGGAVGHVIESIEARKVTNAVKRLLEAEGHSVFLNNVDNAKSQSEYLKKVVSRANASKYDLFVSIHFNAGGGKGCECYTWKGDKVPAALGICKELNKLGFRNRGVKNGSNLYVVRNTTAIAVLVEVCFVDTKSDCDLYKKLGVSKVAHAITRGILHKGM